jgi:thiol-disulfide isomerase/thioredoxin
MNLKNYYIAILLFCFLARPAFAENRLPSELWEEIKTATQIQDNEIIYIDFWASWCGPCAKSFPWLNQMNDKYQDKGLKILAINVDIEREFAQTFLASYPAQFNIHYDPEGKFASAFNLPGMPTSYILDSTGQLLSKHLGFKEKKADKYENTIQELLKK